MGVLLGMLNFVYSYNCSLPISRSGGANELRSAIITLKEIPELARPRTLLMDT